MHTSEIYSSGKSMCRGGRWWEGKKVGREKSQQKLSLEIVNIMNLILTALH